MMFSYDEDWEGFFTNYKILKAQPSYVVKFDRKRISEELSKILDAI